MEKPAEECVAVKHIKYRSEEGISINNAIFKHHKDKDNRLFNNIYKFRIIINYKDWYISEVEFSDAEPVVYLIYRKNRDFRIRSA
jgi:hypothetical protein